MEIIKSIDNLIFTFDEKLKDEICNAIQEEVGEKRLRYETIFNKVISYQQMQQAAKDSPDPERKRHYLDMAHKIFQEYATLRGL
jgi:hypothetical protein